MTPARRSLLPLGLALTALAALVGCRGGAPSAPPEAPPAPAVAEAPSPVARGVAVVGQAVYVPIYSHIYFRDGAREINLAATLSVRNADPERPITVTAVRYHDSAGGLVRRYLEAPLALAPLASQAYVVEDRDRTGGVGASFVVEWEAAEVVSPPVVQGVMIGTSGSQGISFVTEGRAVRSLPAPSP